MVTFAVDDVAPVVSWMPRVAYGADTPDALLYARDPASLRVVSHGATHALLGAVHTAFAEHRPLVLTPDAIWLTIAHGVAHHVRLHADQLRSRLVRHQGKKTLELRVGEIPGDAAGWAGSIAQFRALLAAEIGEGRARLFECSFSTSTEIDLIASQVVLMDAYAPFFDYAMVCVCGIPTITLEGTVDDWRAIRQRVDVIAEFGLEQWCQSLAPILDEFVRAAEGAPDRTFWKRICNPHDAYGGEVVTGWIARLYPYVVSGSEAAHPNPLLALPIDEPKNVGKDEWPTGIKTADVVAGPCSVVINISGLTATRAVQLEAGVQLVVQDDHGRLVPITDWRLRPGRARIEDVAERIRKDHRYTPSLAPTLEEGSAEMIGFYNLISSASLFDGKWTIRAAADRTMVPLAGVSWSDVHRTVDGNDGRFLAAAGSHGQTLWVLGGPDDPELHVVGSTFADVVNALLDTGEPPATQRVFGRRRLDGESFEEAFDAAFSDEEPTA